MRWLKAADNARQPLITVRGANPCGEFMRRGPGPNLCGREPHCLLQERYRLLMTPDTLVCSRSIEGKPGLTMTGLETLTIHRTGRRKREARIAALQSHSQVPNADVGNAELLNPSIRRSSPSRGLRLCQVRHRKVNLLKRCRAKGSLQMRHPVPDYCVV